MKAIKASFGKMTPAEAEAFRCCVENVYKSAGKPVPGIWDKNNVKTTLSGFVLGATDGRFWVCGGDFSLSSERIHVQAAEMEEDVGLETLTVAVAA